MQHLIFKYICKKKTTHHSQLHTEYFCSTTFRRTFSSLSLSKNKNWILEWSRDYSATLRLYRNPLICSSLRCELPLWLLLRCSLTAATFICPLFLYPPPWITSVVVKTWWKKNFKISVKRAKKAVSLLRSLKKKKKKMWLKERNQKRGSESTTGRLCIHAETHRRLKLRFRLCWRCRGWWPRRSTGRCPGRWRRRLCDCSRCLPLWLPADPASVSVA